MTLGNPNPSAGIALGDPLRGPGANIGFPVFQTEHWAQLYTVMIIATSSATDVFIQVEARSPSTDNFDCPLLTLCDAPVFTRICVAGEGAYIDSNIDVYGDAVESATWSRPHSEEGRHPPRLLSGHAVAVRVTVNR